MCLEICFLDSRKSLRDTIAAMLPMLLPFNIATASASKTIENLLKAMNGDVNALASQSMAALLEQILPPMAKDSTVVQSVVKKANETLSQMAKDPGSKLSVNFVHSVAKTILQNQTLSRMAMDLGSKLPVNSTKQLVDGTIRQLLPGDTGNILANMVGSFIGLNATRQIASIVNFDPNRPVSEVMTHVMGILQQCDKGLSHLLAVEK